MEHQIGGKSVFHGPVVSELKAMGKRAVEWDENGWKWDSHRLRASPLTLAPSDCRSRQLFPLGPEFAATVSNSTSSCSDEANVSDENGSRESEKKRRIVPGEDEELNVGAVPLNLMLYPIVEAEVDKCEGKSGKKSKGAGTIPACQVEGCTADLSHAKDYHRRHKVCEMHSKATEALVGNVMQRFCQQCSRFHALQEFDEGKRSCRRRLAGHNKRRRKAQPEPSANMGSLIDETSARQLLISLITLLSNMQRNSSDTSNDQDLLPQLVRNLATLCNGSNTSGLLQGSQCVRNTGDSNGIPAKSAARFEDPTQTTPSTDAQGGILGKGNQCNVLRTRSVSQPNVLHGTGGFIPPKGSAQEASVRRHIIDLNNACNDDLQDCIKDPEMGNGCVTRAYWLEESLPSPPQTSGNSASTSGRSSSSSGLAQYRTDRIVFKLFGKDPNDFPSGLRTQILDWLSLSPTDIEGFIRPGCIILTLYLRLNESLWEQLSYDMSSTLSRLLVMSNDPFWNGGWIYTRIQQQAAFICDGQVVLDTTLPFKSGRSRILSISPIAVPPAETVQLVVKGFNLSGPTSGLLCAVEGRYLVQESCYGLVEEDTDVFAEQDEVQSLSFGFHVPDVVGRGFVEVEDYGLTGCFFPFIVAEPEVSSEICTLEGEIEVVNVYEDIEGECGETGAKNNALNFVHEMGWLLHINHVRLMTAQTESQSDLFPFERLKWLVEFSMDHEWRAVLRKLMDLLFTGTVNTEGFTSVEDALTDMALLHSAVQRNSRPLVEFLLRYVPKKEAKASFLDQKQPDSGRQSSMIFRPDMTVAGGLTPLHIAASRVGSDNVLDALLEDPRMVGIEAWKNARDSTGLTPSDYASLRGHFRYIDLAKRKNNLTSSAKHVVLDITSLNYLDSSQKQGEKLNFKEFEIFYSEKPQTCKLCEQKPHSRFGGAPLMFRPAMIALVVAAVVCVCTALLFKSELRVSGIFGPFRWDALKYGAM